jgi:hypothetical protein
MLAKFNLSNCHPVSLPADKGAMTISKSMSPQEQDEKDMM